MNTIGGKILINNNLPHALISPREFDKDGLYTIFGGDKVIVTDTDPKPEPQSNIIEGKVRNDLYVIPSTIVQSNHPLYSTNNDNNVNNTTTNNKEPNAMYTTSNTIDISKPPTIHVPNAIEQRIPCEHYMFGHLSHDKLESIIPNINKFITKQLHMLIDYLISHVYMCWKMDH
eukprot:Pgem_evm1s11568